MLNNLINTTITYDTEPTGSKRPDKDILTDITKELVDTDGIANYINTITDISKMTKLKINLKSHEGFVNSLYRSTFDEKKIKTINLHDYLIKLIQKLPKREKTNWDLETIIGPGIHKQNIVSAYYYTLFIKEKQAKDAKYKPTLKDFDKFLSNIANKKRDDFKNSNGIEYALINNLRTSLEAKFPKHIAMNDRNYNTLILYYYFVNARGSSSQSCSGLSIVILR
jgi:hypothetical protein